MKLSIRGVQLPSYAQLTATRPIGKMPVSAFVGVPLVFYHRADEVATVAEGDAVERGAWYRPQNSEDCFLSTVSGFFESVVCLEDDEYPCAVLQASGPQDRILPVASPVEKPDAKFVRNVIRDAAIYDELSGQSLEERIRLWRRLSPDMLVVDVSPQGAFGTAGEAAFRTAPHQVYKAAKLLANLCGIKKCVVAVPSSRRFRAIIRSLGRKRMTVCDDVYPHETVLFGRKTVVTVGPQAMLALWRALQFGEPQTEMVVTVSGDALESPQNLSVPIGSTAEDLLRCCHPVSESFTAVRGDALNGEEIADLSVPLWQNTTCIVVMKKPVGVKNPAHCIHCGACVAACHKGLNPCMIRHLYLDGDFENLASYRADQCDGCGACSYICVSGCEVAETVCKAAVLGNAVEIAMEGEGQP